MKRAEQGDSLLENKYPILSAFAVFVAHSVIAVAMLIKLFLVYAFLILYEGVYGFLFTCTPCMKLQRTGSGWTGESTVSRQSNKNALSSTHPSFEQPEEETPAPRFTVDIFGDIESTDEELIERMRMKRQLNNDAWQSRLFEEHHSGTWFGKLFL